jgi:hypothetical protein
MAKKTAQEHPAPPDAAAPGAGVPDTGVPVPGDDPAPDHGLFDEDHFYGGPRGASPGEPPPPPAGTTPEAETPEPAVRPDASGRRHERDLLPRP